MEQENTLEPQSGSSGGGLSNCPKCGSSYSQNILFCTADGTKLEPPSNTQSTASSRSHFADKYEILDTIGSGGMGTVYRVRQVFLNKVYALKVIPADMLTDQLVTRFQQEAKMMAALDHQNLGRIVDFGLFKNQPFMVMEFIDGVPLSKMIATAPLSSEESIEIFSQVLNGLAHAHKRSILHRDIKPSNIMVVTADRPDERGHVDRKAILVDFGIAKKLDSNDVNSIANSRAQALTKTGEMIGSPLYMSPEQARGEALSERSDLYSLGCALFECLTGSAPFVGKTIVDTLISHMEAAPPTLREASLGRDFTAGVERATRMLLAKDPIDRYHSAEEAKRALQLALQIHEEEKSPQKSAMEKAKTPKVMILAAVSIAVAVTAGGLALTAIQKPTVVEQHQIIPSTAVIEDTVSEVVEERFALRESKHEVPQGKDDDDYSSDFRKKYDYVPVVGDEKEILLRGQDIDSDRIKKIAADKNLTLLGMAEARFPHEMLNKLPPQLKHIRAGYTDLTDNDVKAITERLSLKSLVVPGNTITNKSISYLLNMKSLEMLGLGDTHVDAQGIGMLKALPNLHALNLQKNHLMDDRAAQQIASLKELARLNIDDTLIKEKGIALISKLPSLKQLHMGKMDLHDRDIASLRQTTTLRGLFLPHNKLTAKSIKNLVPLKKLKELDIMANPIDDSAIPYLLQMPTLKLLSLEGTILTPEGILKLAALPDLEHLVIRRIKNLNDEHVFEFMNRSKSCQEIVFLPEKKAGYKRKDWLIDRAAKSQNEARHQ